MLVFIDESGDAGMQRRPGSSDFFVMVAVIFDDQEEADKCDRKISELRSGLSKSGNKEYKFNRCNREERERFFNGVSPFQFQYVAFVVNKEALHGSGIDLKIPFYKYTAKLLFDDAKQYLALATVILDRCGDREFRRQLEIHIKKA
jgi:hypothetical protein